MSKKLNCSQPSPVEVETVSNKLEAKQGSSVAVDRASTSDGGIVQVGLAVPRYVIPQRISTLGLLEPPFTPKLTPGTLRVLSSRI